MSHRTHLQPQHALEELARITLADHSLATVMETVANLTRWTVPGAQSVSVTFVDRGKASTAGYTGELALQLDERQYERGYGPCLGCIAGGEVVRVDDTSNEERWPQFTADARRFGAGSSLSVPVPVQREIAAAVNVYGTTAHAFDERAVELAKTFAAYAGVALANNAPVRGAGPGRRAALERMQSRAVIEQAKGILMGARRCTSDEAFDLLVRLSQDTNRKLRDVARAVVDDATASPDTGA